MGAPLRIAGCSGRDLAVLRAFNRVGLGISSKAILRNICYSSLRRMLCSPPIAGSSSGRYRSEQQEGCQFDNDM